MKVKNAMLFDAMKNMIAIVATVLQGIIYLANILTEKIFWLTGSKNTRARKRFDQEYARSCI
jgi:hypothetical protein